VKIRIRPHDASMPQETEWLQTDGWLAALRDDDSADPADDDRARPLHEANAQPEVLAEAAARAKAVARAQAVARPRAAARAEGAARAARTVRAAHTARAVIGDQLRIPIIWCEMRSCVSWHADPEALGEADNRRRAFRAGWRIDALGRLACPQCQQTDADFWATAPVVPWDRYTAIARAAAGPSDGTATAWRGRRQGPAGPRPYRCPFCLCPEIDPAATAVPPPRPPNGTAGRWLMPAARMADLVCGCWRSSPDPALTGRGCVPAIATRALSAEGGSVGAARDFTHAVLRRQSTGHNRQDILVVVSELVTNALRHALRGPGDTGVRGPIGLGLLQHGRWLLCAVADPAWAVPVPRTPAALTETGRGLQMVHALSDRWGYTAPGETGKVVWAVFAARPVPALAAAR
jgi:hypothetical protein